MTSVSGTTTAHEPAVWGLVGNTPLIPLAVDGPGRLALKAEWMNPGGSVKDRPARAILRAGIAEGLLPGRRLLDASSGNTAIAYAMLGASAGIGVTICLPANASTERRQLLAAYGAEVIETDPLEGTDGAIAQARVLHKTNPDRYWYGDQYSHAANARSHFETTGPEIWRQSAGAVTHLVCGLGTSGTAMGAGRFLRSRNPALRVVAVQPDGPFHGLEGLKHMATAIVPALYDEAEVDETMFVTTEAAETEVGTLTRRDGLFGGWSSGAAAVAARKTLEREAGPTTFVVAIAPDGGGRYLSEVDRFEAARGR